MSVVTCPTFIGAPSEETSERNKQGGLSQPRGKCLARPERGRARERRLRALFTAEKEPQGYPRKYVGWRMPANLRFSIIVPRVNDPRRFSACYAPRQLNNGRIGAG